ncbi:MAG: hypothetical protein MUP90_16915, partial [Gammaproteobacteria bacterium]|nr:hypothetical protein [Gammaproteobacteria bacterium]
GPYRVNDVFADHPTLGNSIVVTDKAAGAMQAVAYTDTGEAVEFAPRAEWQAVELTYQFVNAAAEVDLLRRATTNDLAESADFALPVSVLGIAENENGDGLTYVDLLPLGPGWGNGRDNHYYSEELVRQIAPMWVGAKQYATDHRQEQKSVLTEVSEIVKSPAGFTEGVKDVPDGTPYARAVILRDDFAEIVKNRAKAGILENLHCSILASGTARAGFELAGRKGKLVESITQVQAVDWVTRAGARGRALAIAESEDGTMGKAKDKKDKDDLQETETVTVEETGEDTKTVTMLEAATVEAKLAETKLPGAFKAALALGEYADDGVLAEAIAQAVKEVKAITGSGQPFAQGASQPVDAVPLSEVEIEEKRKVRFNEIMAQVGLKGV